jgi:hypothetical protein
MRIQTVTAVVALLVCLINQPLSAQEPHSPEALVFFGNGVWTTKSQASDSAKALRFAFKDRHFPLLTDRAFDTAYPFDHSYNRTSCVGDPPDPLHDPSCLLDLKEALQQAAQAGGFPFKYKSFWHFLLGLVLDSPDLFNIFSGVLQAKAVSFNPQAITFDDLREQVTRYRDTIDGGSKVLLVVHSQGNLFGNQTYIFLSPTQRASFGMVSVATPASFVAGGGPYTTLHQDFIHHIPGALPPNVLSPLCGIPLTCHGFVGAYLDEQESRNKILDDMIEVLDSLTDPLPSPGGEVIRYLEQGDPGEPGKDIWTTNVFSYAPGGVGPGGGLDDDLLRVGGWADSYFSLLEFDLTGLPHPAQSARLELFSRPQDNSTALYLDRITEPWDWRTQGTGSDRERLWWADRPAAVQWRQDTLPPPTPGQWYSIDITHLYNAWQAGTYPNYGVQLRPVSTNNTWAEFYSANSADQALRPRLVVEPGSGTQTHPMIGVWRGTVAGYAAEMTIEQSGGIFSARLSMDQANEPVEQLDVRSATETTFVAYRPADRNAELRLCLTQSGTQQCLVGDYIENGGSRPISLCKVL